MSLAYETEQARLLRTAQSPAAYEQGEAKLLRRVLGVTPLAETLVSPTITVSAIRPAVAGTHTLSVDAPEKVVGSTFNFAGHAELSPESAPYYDWSKLEIYRDGVLFATMTMGFPRDGDTPLDYNIKDTPDVGDHSYYTIAYVEAATL